MTKIETLKNSAEALFGSDNPTISGEEYLELLESAKSRAEKEYYTPNKCKISSEFNLIPKSRFASE